MVTVEFIAVVQLEQTSLELNSVTFGNSTELTLGQPIAVIGSPFGCISPVSFFNSISSGVISHSFEGHENADMVLTDARCLPGTEGGGVFDGIGNLVGVVAPRLTSTIQPLDMTFIIPSNQISEILANITRVTVGNPIGDVFLPQNVLSARKSIVCLQIGNTWASGFVVSNHGRILQ